MIYATIGTALAVASIIYWARAIVRTWQRREADRQRRIARAQRLAMAGKRRARVIRSEAAANQAMSESI